MPAKLQYYSELAERQARRVTGSREDWTGFLTTAGRLYKYPFDEQLMIYAQRPDATACAPLEMWNKPMNRYVRQGSKGIALIDNSADSQNCAMCSTTPIPRMADTIRAARLFGR